MCRLKPLYDTHKYSLFIVIIIIIIVTMNMSICRRNIASDLFKISYMYLFLREVHIYNRQKRNMCAATKSIVYIVKMKDFIEEHYITNNLEVAYHHIVKFFRS